MTIRRQWLIVLITTAILAVAVNSLVLSSLTNRYFDNYTTENYDSHLTQLVEFSKQALLEDSYTNDQISTQLESHLVDPIVKIELYDANGQLIAKIQSDEAEETRGMMKNRAMNSMFGTASEEVDNVEISNSGVLLGKLYITRYSSLGNSIGNRMFKVSLINNSLLSVGLVLIFVIIFGVLISRKMSRDLTNTASLALNIDLGNPTEVKLSKVREIRTIQQSLETLKTRLKLKQTSRKNLVDELVHQTRTPLTILKTHLEAFEDGIVEMTPEEIKICEDQIDNITAMIANMSSMLDAEKDTEAIKSEEFELNQLLKQIIGGLKVQFEKKQIDLSVKSNHKVVLKTDKYKLSQSIYNVLTNAYKFTEARGTVSISYMTSKDELVMTIEDSGIGISEKDKEHLFEAYYRGDNTNNIIGEGIGLYIAKENINKIQGAISVVSEVGSGSKFIIKIPKNI